VIVLDEVLLAHASVEHVQSSIVLDRLKQTTTLPLPVPADGVGAGGSAHAKAGRTTARRRRPRR
jgi:hypothetical protein